MPYTLMREPKALHRGHGHSRDHLHGGGADDRRIQVERRVLDENERMAAENRRRFGARRIFVLNLMSSPGSGKTTLLQKTLADLTGKVRCAVIVGDICTSHDADRLWQFRQPLG